jgi:hypothetical protein
VCCATSENVSVVVVKTTPANFSVVQYTPRQQIFSVVQDSPRQNFFSVVQETPRQKTFSVVAENATPEKNFCRSNFKRQKIFLSWQKYNDRKFFLSF